MFIVTRMTYVLVKSDTTPAPPVLRAMNEGVSAFLADHIEALRKLAADRQTQPGRFLDADGHDLFRGLYAGEEAAFLAAADGLAKRLIAEMDGRTSEGVLVCLRATDGDDLVAGVMKLQVAAPHGAVIKQLASGELELAAVTQMLDKPGDLHKGALVASWLADDRVLTGDRLLHDAAYFPRAFGIKIYARPRESPGQLLGAVQTVAPGLVSSAMAALPAIPAGEPQAVVAELGRQVPGLTPQQQAAVVEALESLPRPVGRIETRQPVRSTIKIGTITVSGPAADMQQYARVEGPDRQSPTADNYPWRVIVGGHDQPRQSYG